MSTPIALAPSSHGKERSHEKAATFQTKVEFFSTLLQ
jgi:hypothetical protein